MFASLFYLLNAVYFSVSLCEGIINGTDARQGEFPFVVSLRNESGLHFCGGALLSTRKHILTAGHCLFTDRSMINQELYEPHDPMNVAVLAGTINANDTSGGKLYKVKKLTPHPEYDVMNRSSFMHDIGIVTLLEEVNLPTVSTIELCEDDLTSGIVAVQVGWGVSERKAINSWITTPILQKLEKKVVNSTECLQKLKVVSETELIDISRRCNNMFNEVNSSSDCREILREVQENFLYIVADISEASVMEESLICLHNDAPAGVCYRDSGSPAIVNGKVAGVAAATVPCATNHPDLYTSVKKYLNFIKKEINT